MAIKTSANAAKDLSPTGEECLRTGEAPSHAGEGFWFAGEPISLAGDCLIHAGAITPSAGGRVANTGEHSRRTGGICFYAGEETRKGAAKGHHGAGPPENRGRRGRRLAIRLSIARRRMLKRGRLSLNAAIAVGRGGWERKEVSGWIANCREHAGIEGRGGSRGAAYDLASCRSLLVKNQLELVQGGLAIYPVSPRERGKSGPILWECKMTELRTIRYDNGRWCEQEYVDRKLHGRWTVFYADGTKDWERQYVHGRQEGYHRKWDERGRLVEEMWFHLDVLHGQWKEWDKDGKEEIVADFFYGLSRDALDETKNADFNQLLRPIWGLEPAQFGNQIDAVLKTLRRPSLRLKKSTRKVRDFSDRVSYWNHVNVLGVKEQWPVHRGRPLHPILQINCDEVPLKDHPLAAFSFVTVFAASGDVIGTLGEDIVIRAYTKEDAIKEVKPGCEPLDKPRILSMSKEIDSYPDENDLPAGLKVWLQDNDDDHGVLEQKVKLHSRLGGWPGWLQNGCLLDQGRFAFQIDSLDVENWDCGDCTIHYFFLNDGPERFSWVGEMC